MSQKLLYLTLVISFVAMNVSLANNEPNRRMYPNKVISGEEYSPVITQDNNSPRIHRIESIPPFKSTSFTYTYAPTGVFSAYDLQSNSSPSEIWQDPIIPANVHVVFMNSLQPSGWTDRTCTYLFSNDFGATWGSQGNIPASGSRSGFPSINGLSNGAAVVACHTAEGGGNVRCQLFADAGPGFLVFSTLNPGEPASGAHIWPRITGTSVITNANKVSFCASVNATGGDVATNTCTSLTSPGTFSGYVSFTSNTAEVYPLARGADGRIGQAYIQGTGNVNYRVSTDQGVTFGSPTAVWTYSAADSLGPVRGIGLTFSGNTPYVVFETGKTTDAGFFPGLPSQIRVWSPGLNGGIPKIIADQTTVPFFPYTGVNDVMFPICRPVIGHSSIGNLLICAFMSTTGNVATDSNVFMATWVTTSQNGGTTWTAPEKCSPLTPIRDWRYISISQSSNVSGTPPTCKVQMAAQRDSIPGSTVNGAPPGNAQLIGIRTDIILGITNISTNVPDKFSLKQNFPNPFNPMTSIRFDIVRTSNVILKVYNAQGREVATLVNNELVTPGTKEVTMDASELTSGIYFYTLVAGDFKESKKMMLIK